MHRSNPSNPISLLKAIGAAALGTGALFAMSAKAATLHSVKLGWNAAPESGIEGYKVYVGTASNQYTQSYDSGTALTLTIPDREYGRTYYFAVKTVGAGGLESGYSQELAVTIAPPPLPTGGGMSINGSQRSLTWTFPKAAFSSSPEFVIEQSTNLVNWTVAATVQTSASTGGTTQTANYSWTMPAATGTRRFYRLTAKNWMGMSVTP